jgi:hypothetical protein
MRRILPKKAILKAQIVSLKYEMVRAENKTPVDLNKKYASV